MKDTIYFQTKHFSEVKATEDGVTIEGFASTKDIDRYQDIVNPKAFEAAIKGFKKNPIMLLQHNHEKVIGLFKEFTVTSKGLKVKGEVTNDIDNVVSNIQNGLLKGFSIGFIAKNWEYKEKDGKEVRIITELELLEISVVSVPANPFTLFQAVKKYFSSINNETMKDGKEIKEEILDEKQIEEEKMSPEEIANAPVEVLEGEALKEAQEEQEAAAEAAEKEEEKEEQATDEKSEEEEDDTAEEEEAEEEEKTVLTPEMKKVLQEAGLMEKDGEEAADEAHELHNETPDESENSDESSEETEETEEAETEEAEGNSEAETEEATEDEKSGEDEVDVKELVGSLVSIIEKQAEKLEEFETVIGGISVKKGIKTIGSTATSKGQADSAWSKAFKDAKKGY